MRSMLFVPGDRPERFERACACGAGAVIVDLEDAVAPEARADARGSTAGWLVNHSGVLLRVNAVNTVDFRLDMEVAGLPGVGGVVVAKAESAEEIARVAATMSGRPVYPLIESAWGLQRAQEIGAVPGVGALIFGSMDFQADLGIRGDGFELHPYRAQLVLASRLAGLPPPIDGVTVALDSDEGLRIAAASARGMGFGGKLCIHPKQVAVVNEAFGPTKDELNWAARVVAADAASNGAATRIDGQMVDRAIVVRARNLLAQNERGVS
jgi:citrate lyase subunit beta/citryl-CoA lyase